MINHVYVSHLRNLDLIENLDQNFITLKFFTNFCDLNKFFTFAWFVIFLQIPWIVLFIPRPDKLTNEFLKFLRGIIDLSNEFEILFLFSNKENILSRIISQFFIFIQSNLCNSSQHVSKFSDFHRNFIIPRKQVSNHILFLFLSESIIAPIAIIFSLLAILLLIKF